MLDVHAFITFPHEAQLQIGRKMGGMPHRTSFFHRCVKGLILGLICERRPTIDKSLINIRNIRGNPYGTLLE
jgi:hypothetical protein